ncbi:hypothetical protein ACFWV1_26000 [Streptomyces sp. NPDC058700]|uniref:hypothetical protein n=1 Tax=Streptomyces sp. NPDC058700 TaxID=3346607 RepID=UPI0036604342
MSDPEGTATGSEAAEKRPEVVEQVIDLDLRLLVSFYNAHKENSLSITLHVPGGIVSGELIGREAYLERWDAVVGAVEQGEGLVGVQRMTQGLLDEAGVPKSDDLPRWIHLRDVAVMAPNRLVTFPFWRGRLADVSGWSLGAMRES